MRTILRARLLALSFAGSLAACDSPPEPSDVTATSSVASAATASAAPTATTPPEPVVPWLEKTLRDDAELAPVLAAAETHRLQILVTEVDDGKLGERHAFRVDAEYFYPASAIKTYLAIAALRATSEQLGEDIHLRTRIMRCAPRKPGCEPPERDEDKEKEPDEDGKRPHDKIYLGQEITKLLTYSNNDSYNRLWDIVGHREANEWMAKIGFPDVILHHRMDTPAPRSRDTMRTILPVPGKKTLTIRARDSDYEAKPTPAQKLIFGDAHYDRGKLIEEPMDFGNKNYSSLADLQRLMISLLFPNDAEAAPLGLSDAQREHLLAALTGRLSPRKFADDHKPMLPGVLEVREPDEIRYVSKSGRAYGFHLENAYIEDVKSKRGYFVTATIYANPNGTLNDDDYGYDDTTRPFLARLGKVLSEKLLGERAAAAEPD